MGGGRDLNALSMLWALCHIVFSFIYRNLRDRADFGWTSTYGMSERFGEVKIHGRCTTSSLSRETHCLSLRHIPFPRMIIFVVTQPPNARLRSSRKTIIFTWSAIYNNQYSTIVLFSLERLFHTAALIERCSKWLSHDPICHGLVPRVEREAQVMYMITPVIFVQ